MDEIGNLFLVTRETAGLSLDEVCDDLDIDKVILENIEDGKTGAFSDIFLLKNYVYEYAKYLGLDSDKIVDEFNEFVFESTSKIPVKEIEKEIIQNKKNEETDKVFSPYTHAKPKSRSAFYIIIYTLLVIAIIFFVFVLVKELIYGSIVASTME